MLTYHRTTEEEKYNITSWKYEGKYSIYNEKPYEGVCETFSVNS